MSKWPEWLPLRDDLRSLSPYGAPQIEGIIRLNTNENPFSLKEGIVKEIANCVEKIAENLNRYPDRDAVRLREKLAQYINALSGTEFDVTHIWASNGSNEVLQTLFLAFGGYSRTALGFVPSYSVHPLIARITGTAWIPGERTENFSLNISSAISQIKEHKPTLVFITTPNNPTGTATPLADIKLLAAAAGEVGALLVVDEAYAEFSSEDSAVTLINSLPQVVVCRTMSKAFAFAGVRLGYLVARAEVVDGALVTRLPYHLSALTQGVAEVALDHAQSLQEELQQIKDERKRVEEAIRQSGWQSFESAANFLLFKGFEERSSEVWKQFLDRGVLIRDVSLEGHLRVTIGTPEENDRFISAMREIAG